MDLFIYSIQVSESIMWRDWSSGSAAPSTLGNYHSFSVVDAFGCAHGGDGSIFSGENGSSAQATSKSAGG